MAHLRGKMVFFPLFISSIHEKVVILHANWVDPKRNDATI